MADDNDPDDWDTDIRWLRQMLVNPQRDDIDAAEATAELALCHLRRFEALRNDWPDDRVRDEVDRLVGDVGALRTGPAAVADSVLRQQLTMLHAFAIFIRYRELTDPDDRAAAIDMFAGVLPAMADDTPFLDLAWDELGMLYADLYFDGHDPAVVDSWLNANRRALQLTDPTSDDWPQRSLAELTAAHEKSDVTGDPADLNTAIDCFADHLSSDQGSHDLWFDYGLLLNRRSEINKTIEDLTEAITWFRRAAGAADADDSERLTYGWALSYAYDQRWKLTGDTADREQVVACVDAIDVAAVTDMWTYVDLQVIRLGALGSRIEGQFGAGTMPLRDHIRDLLDGTFTALSNWTEPDQAFAAESAETCASVEVRAFTMDPAYIDRQRVERWIAIAREHPDPPEDWAQLLQLISGVGKTLKQMIIDTGSLDGVRELVAALRDSSPEFRSAARIMVWVVGSIAFMAGGRNGDLAMSVAAAELLRSVDSDGVDEPVDPEVALFAAVAELTPAVRRGDPGVVAELARRVKGITADLPGTMTISPALEWITSLVRTMATVANAPDIPAMLPAAAPDDFGGWFTPLFTAGRVAIPMFNAMATRDSDGLLVAIINLETVIDDAELESPGVAVATQLIAIGYANLAEWQPWDKASIDAAVHWNTKAMERWQVPAHPLMPVTLRQLASSLRLRGGSADFRRSRELSRTALRGEALQVLLQSGTDHAAAAARQAAGFASQLAGWCVADAKGDVDAKDDLVRALEAGRGLMLHSAVASRTVAKQLTELGHAELAQEWDTAGGAEWLDTGGLPGLDDVRLPGDLRDRVISTMTSNNAGTDELLSTPSVAEVRATLKLIGVHVLAYLVPTGPHCDGMAVLVPQHGDVEIVPLPDLATDDAIITYTNAYRDWEQATGLAGRREAFDDWQEQLDLLGGWAWRVAGERLSTVARGMSGVAVPKVALVPFGMLAVVPWHCAWRPAEQRTTGRRYLVQDMVVSVVPSARMLGEVVNRESVTVGDTLLVGNPADSLLWAWRETEAIAHAFYRQATWLGMRSQPGGPGVAAQDGPGTAAEVLDWLDKHDTTPRRLLHLACHARADATHPGESAVGLADGQLEITALLDRWPTSRLHLEAVVLSGCTTDVSANNYDEAFSIATAFLALGARTVLGSMWHVRDVHTAIFMFMFHHHLTTLHPITPSVALHKTRLWMIDSNREFPNTMPEQLRDRARYLPPDRPLDHPAFWAAFNHLGV